MDTEKVDEVNVALDRDEMTKEVENPLAINPYVMGFSQGSEALKTSPIREVEPTIHDDDIESFDFFRQILESAIEDSRGMRRRMQSNFIPDEDEESSPSSKYEKQIYIVAKRIKLLEIQIRIIVAKQQKLQGQIKSMMKKTLKKERKPLKVAIENLIKSNALLKQATITAERISQ